MTMQEFTKAVRPRVLANKNFNKIFCIGYNKTGTTTLETVLRLYGYQLPNQQEQEIRLSKNVFSTEYEELKGFCSNYDAFQDMPFSQGLTYVAADALFPNSKFILTERAAESWFKSMCGFHKKVFNIDDLSKLTEKDIVEKFTYLYPGYSHANRERLLSSFNGEERHVRWDKLYDYELYTKMYASRNEEIKRYFMNAPHKLLVIDVTKETSTKRLCDFLNIPSELSIDMPHRNKT
ncbi:MAG: sulfotransferase [Pseudomonadota bacterium]